MTWLNKFLVFNENKEKPCMSCSGTGKIITKLNSTTNAFIMLVIVLNIITLGTLMGKQWYIGLAGLLILLPFDFMLLKEYKEQTR